MAQYHVNPKTGDPSLCRAGDPANCPFGGSAGHTQDPLACYEIYARVMADYLVPRPIKASQRKFPVSAERRAAVEAWVHPLVLERRARRAGTLIGGGLW